MGFERLFGLRERGLDVAHPASCPMPTTMATATAGQAADDDVEEGDDSVEDGLEDGGDGVDDAGETAANCCEERFDLWGRLECVIHARWSRKLTQETTAPIVASCGEDEVCVCGGDMEYSVKSY